MGLEISSAPGPATSVQGNAHCLSYARASHASSLADLSPQAPPGGGAWPGRPLGGYWGLGPAMSLAWQKWEGPPS